MFRLYTYIREEHDIKLAAVAGLIRLFATFTAFSLQRRLGGAVAGMAVDAMHDVACP